MSNYDSVYVRLSLKFGPYDPSKEYLSYQGFLHWAYAIPAGGFGMPTRSGCGIGFSFLDGARIGLNRRAQWEEWTECGGGNDI